MALKNSIFPALTIINFTILTICASDGEIDRSFGNNGLARALNNNSAAMSKVAVQSNGNIVTGIFGISAGTTPNTIIRNSPSVSIVSQNGTLLSNTPLFNNQAAGVTGLALYGDDSIVAAGYSVNGSNVLLSKLSSTGIIDKNFGSNGIATIPNVNNAFSFLGPDDNPQQISFLSQILGMAIQPDGKIVISGITSQATNPFNTFFIARLLPSGILDPNFGNAGITKGPIDTLNMGFTALALQPDGKILLAGSGDLQVDSNVHSVLTIARFTENGQLDITFNSPSSNSSTPSPIPGIIRIFIGTFANLSVLGLGITVLPNGRISAGGPTDTGPFATIRLFSDGTLDPSWDVNGIAHINGLISDFDEVPFGGQFILQPDTKVLGVMHGSTPIIMGRLTSIGGPDRSFGNRSLVSAPPLTNAASIALEQNGKIIVGGFTEPNFTPAIVRYLNSIKIAPTSITSTPPMKLTIGTIIQGAAQPLSIVDLFANGVLVGSAWTNTAGQWAITINTDFPQQSPALRAVTRYASANLNIRSLVRSSNAIQEFIANNLCP